MLTDTAYILKAEKILTFYPNMLHLTSVAQGLQRVAETVRLQSPLFEIHVISNCFQKDNNEDE